MNKVKYVVVVNEYDHEQMIIFPETIKHSKFKAMNPIRAGFIDIFTVKDPEYDGYIASCNCFGKSTSLKLESDPKKDSELAKRYIVNFYN